MAFAVSATVGILNPFIDITFKNYVEFITNGAISDINDMPVELTEQLLDAIELDNEEGDE